MELKRYQKNALESLEAFLKESKRVGTKYAFIASTEQPYRADPFEGVPFICIKIPTGGGKTIVASHAIEKIMSVALQQKLDRGIVLWFTPSDAIQTQTLKKLKNRKDWHRRVLDEAFDNNIKVFSNEEALAITKGDVDDNLCLIVASIDAFRKEKTKQNKYKVYQENGALLEHFQNINEYEYLEKDSEDTVINSLANVIRLSQPLVVIDEGHHTQTGLSFDVLKDLNPSFIIEYTATPRGSSNVLIDISASELKAEQMVKIPLVLESVTQWQVAIEQGIEQRKILEKAAKKLKGEYIRPIALLQAQPESKISKNITVIEVKKFLLEQGIKEEEIAIKVSGKNELEDIDLFKKSCPINYIITINALAEGWDCSFAYVLISVANLGAKISVEQIIGRIIRMPDGKRKSIDELNQSYVFASAKNFQEAADEVISSLQSHGYSHADVVSANKKGEIYELEISKAIKADLKVPLMALDKDKLAFEDLVENFELGKQDPKFEFVAHYDNDGKAILDINQLGEWSESKQMRMELQYHDKNYTKEELIQWLDKKLRFPTLEKSDKVIFLKKAVDYQLKNFNLTELSINRYVLANKLSEIIGILLENYAKEVFDNALRKGQITTTPFDAFPNTILLKQPVPKEFNKNLYEKIDLLNKEERQFIGRIDLLSNVKFWVRNREKIDPFYIQGWRKGKFYPDFVAVTKKGSIVALEWKGEDRISNDDTKYKLEIAKEWENLNKNKAYFFLVSNDNVETVLESLTDL